MSAGDGGRVSHYYSGWPHVPVVFVSGTPWHYSFGPFPQPIDWSPPKGERIGGVPPWQGGYLLERVA